MENNEDKGIFNFSVNEETKAQLQGISQWAKINAIIGFASLGISIISGVLMMSKSTYYAASKGVLSSRQSIVGWFISLAMNIILLNAANNIKKAVSVTDQFALQNGMGNLAKYFKILGIICIIALVLVILGSLVLALFVETYSR